MIRPREKRVADLAALRSSPRSIFHLMILSFMYAPNTNWPASFASSPRRGSAISPFVSGAVMPKDMSSSVEQPFHRIPEGHPALSWQRWFLGSFHWRRPPKSFDDNDYTPNQP